MVELEDEAVFTATAEQVRFNSRANGDDIIFKGVHLDAVNGAALAYLIGAGKTVAVEIKEAQ